MTNPLGDTEHFVITDEIRRRRRRLAQQIYSFQRIRYDDGFEQFRLGYYIIGKKPGPTKGKWVWGQYCTMIPKEDFQPLISEAVRRGWIDLSKSAPC